MDILEKIVAHKISEVEKQKTLVTVKMLEEIPTFHRTPFSLKKQLLKENSSGIIAEFKRKSPSKGIINDQVTAPEVTQGYQNAGASGVSILTDYHFFGGNSEDLKSSRQILDIPILRKEFIIDEYQIIEAKALGADVILLIAECLEEKQIKHFTKLARSLDMEVLLELHSAEQLAKITEWPDMIGVNNRNLATFQVSIENSLLLAEHLPEHVIKISESGLSNPQSIQELKKAGFKGFLIGENFMAQPKPGLACAEFIQKILKD